MATTRRPLTLSIDIGGTGITAMILDAQGRPVTEREREKTPRPATPRSVMAVVRALAERLPDFDRVSVGFPGVILRDVVRTAANLDSGWVGRRPAALLRTALRKPVRVINDADMQGLGIVEGRGVELLVTLGTGIGSALFLDGRLIPNLELGHHPFRNGDTYEEQLGDGPLKRIGRRRWNKRLRLAIKTLRRVFTPRLIYLGGGNARLVQEPLPRDAVTVSNFAGILGGIRLWDEGATGHH